MKENISYVNLAKGFGKTQNFFSKTGENPMDMGDSKEVILKKSTQTDKLYVEAAGFPTSFCTIKKAQL